MSSPASTSSPDADISQTLKRMREEEVDQFPVLDRDDQITGIVTRSDILKRIHPIEQEKPVFSEIPVENVMTEDVITTDRMNLIEEVASTLLKHRINALPVEEEGKINGIITKSDIFECLIHLVGIELNTVRMEYEFDTFGDGFMEAARLMGDRDPARLLFFENEEEDHPKWQCLLRLYINDNN